MRALTFTTSTKTTLYAQWMSYCEVHVFSLLMWFRILWYGILSQIVDQFSNPHPNTVVRFCRNSRSQSCPYCRGSLKSVRCTDLWVLTSYTDVVDPVTLAMDNLRSFYLYIENLPTIVHDAHVLLFDYMIWQKEHLQRLWHKLYIVCVLPSYATEDSYPQLLNSVVFETGLALRSLLIRVIDNVV